MRPNHPRLTGRTPKGFLSGTHRAIPPETTWQRIAPLLPQHGITRVADLTGLDRIGLPVAVAIRPLSRSIVVAAGKGVDLVAAKVSAAMEAIECAHAETIDMPLVFASRSELAGRARAVRLDDLPRTEDVQLDDDTRLMWIEGTALDDGQPALVPYELVHAHYCRPKLPAAEAFQATTNGLSSGNTFAEAVSHGLCEVIERDALALWSLAAAERQRDTLLAPGFDDAPEAAAVADRLERAGFAVAVWDITSDIGVPAFHCLIVDRDEPGGHPGTGTGCHPDSRVALFRALSEAVQVRAVYISGGRDDLVRREYEAAHLQSFQRLFDFQGGRQGAVRRFTDVSFHAAGHIEDDVAWMLARLEAAGCGPAVALDLSRPESTIAVVRIIVPGLEGPPSDTARPGMRAARVVNEGHGRFRRSVARPR